MISARDLALGLLVILIWSINIVAIKVIVGELEPFTAMSLRFVLTTLIFLPFARWPGRDKVWLIAQIAILLCVLHQGALFWSLVRLDGSTTSILLQLQVIFSVLAGWLIFKEKIGIRTASGIGLGILGVIILVGMPAVKPATSGVLGMIVCTSTLALAYARMKALKNIAPATYLVVLHAIASVPIIGLAFAFESPLAIDWAQVDMTKFAIVLAYQVTLTSAAHMLWQRLMSRSEMTILPTLTLLVPVMGVFFSALLLGEKVTPAMLVGGAVTMTGVAIIMIRRRQKKLCVDGD